MSKIIVTVVNDASSVRALLSQGFCPVECSVGGASIMDDLKMDHHGEASGLEAVSIRAYRDHYGARKDDPRFVLVGAPDADACFAIASLAGILPHPSVEVPAHLPPPVKASKQRDLSALAETVATIDEDPIGRDISSMAFGAELLLWNALMAFNDQDSASAEAGVWLWKQLASGAPPRKSLIEAAKVTEQERRDAAAGDEITPVLVEGAKYPIGLLPQSRTWGFDVWYGRNTEAPADSPEGWAYPCVVALAERTKSITLGCPNEAVAEALFGEGGLKNVFPVLEPAGWGGRETVGGSPRGMTMSIELATEAVRVIASKML